MNAGHEFTLGEAFTLQMGKTPARDNPLYWSGSNKWISIADIKEKCVAGTKECISDLAVQETKIKAVPKGTLIMSFKLSVGKVAFTAEDMYTNEAIIAFIDKGKYPIDMDYFFHYLGNQDWRKGANKAVKGLTLNKKSLSARKIRLPSLDVQRDTANTLNLLDRVIQICRRLLETSDALVKARFVEMFGNCVANPKNWKTKRLEDIAEVGSSKRVFVKELQGRGIPFYRGTEVGALAEGKQITPELFITEEHYTELCSATGAPQIGDLLMPSICPDGRIWLVNTDQPFYFKDGRVLWVHTIDDSYNPAFLLYTLKDRIMTDYSSIASGTTFAELKIFALKKCRVFDVPLTLQNEFAAFAAQADQSKLAVNNYLKKAKLLKAALVQQYFG